jgi:hypothetical protein
VTVVAAGLPITLDACARVIQSPTKVEGSFTDTGKARIKGCRGVSETGFLPPATDVLRVLLLERKWNIECGLRLGGFPSRNRGQRTPQNINGRIAKLGGKVSRYLEPEALAVYELKLFMHNLWMISSQTRLFS